LLSGWSLSDWKYKIPIIIHENSGEYLIDYQVLIKLNSTNFDFSKANPDGSDIRFTYLNSTTNTEENISYWIEYWNPTSENASIWIKTPYIPAGGSAIVYMYYGNPNAVSESNGDATFVFFDDFNDGVWTDKWIQGDTSTITISETGDVLDINGMRGSFEYLETYVSFSPGVALYTVMRDDTSYWYPCEFGFGYRNNLGISNAPSNNSVMRLIESYNAWRLLTSDGPFGHEDWDGHFIVDNDFHKYELIWTPNEAKIYQDKVLKASITTHVPTTSEKLRIGHPEATASFAQSAELEVLKWRGIFDFILVRKYTNPEPTVGMLSTLIYISPPRDYGTHYGETGDSYNPYFVEDNNSPSIIDMLAGKNENTWGYGIRIN
jgi:hypothetical protein